MLRVAAQHRVEFGEFARSKEDFGQAELEIVIVQTKRLEQTLKEAEEVIMRIRT